MASPLEVNAVHYEDLIGLEHDFEEAEVEIIRTSTSLLTPLYESRFKITSQIPNFWPLVLEQAPPDIDQYIQPSDSALLLSSLLNISITRFEPEIDPRSLSITFTFKENDVFSNTVLEKKFWHRRNKYGVAGLVSEPVRIAWKGKDKDLTGGLLDLVCNAYEEETAQAKSVNGGAGEGKDKKSGKRAFTPAQKVLQKKIEGTGMGGLSFFAWFGFIGPRISADESEKANKKVKDEREAAKAGKKIEEEEDDDDDEEEEDEEEESAYQLEIFPDGDDLAISFSEDLWPGAIKYFTQAQEADGLSDIDFESDDDEDLDEDDEDMIDSNTNALLQGNGDDENDAPPAKKRRT